MTVKVYTFKPHWIKQFILNLIFATFVLSGISLHAAEVSSDELKGIDEQVQDIKKDVLGLTSELKNLEEKLLFPSNTQFSVFVSLTGNNNFEIDGMQVKVNNKIVAYHAYTFKEVEALRAGAVQRIYTGNAKSGNHMVEVSFVARDSSGDTFQKNASYRLEKGVGPKFVEVVVAGQSGSGQPIAFKDW
ncbi:MAG: hypothetical protein OEY19_09500 [Gammaproteobacteria bacterium]|nr:hypothetical protein [Gammaproteobacteria bacterium]MDH5628761.1 hypothetical protein [Gammaproteobacteria bacterium]